MQDLYRYDKVDQLLPLSDLFEGFNKRPFPGVIYVTSLFGESKGHEWKKLVQFSGP